MKEQNLKKFDQTEESGKEREIVGEKQLFPSIYRIITEGTFLVSLVSTIILAAIVITGFDLYQNLEKKRAIEKKREKIALEIQYWQGIVNHYQGHRDAYFKLATLEYQLNNKDKANEYLQKVFEFDPNFETGRKLEKILNSNVFK